MDAELAFDPELDRLDVEPEASPVGRTGDLDGDVGGLLCPGATVGDAEAVRGLGDARAQLGARSDRLALPARPGADAALPGACAKIGVVLGLIQRLDVSLRAHLPMPMVPVKDEGGTGVLAQLATLARLVIGIKDDVSGCRNDILAEHDARRRLAMLIGGGQHHGIGVGLSRVEPCLLQPL